MLLFLICLKALTSAISFPCCDAKQSQAIYNIQASEDELSEEMLLVENTLRPELASVFSSQTRFDPEHLVTHSSPWSMSKQHYLAALSRRNGLRVNVAQLELVCFNFSFGASNHFNMVFRLSPLMVCQLFPSQAERLNAADSLELSDLGVPDPLPDWNTEPEVSH